MSDIVTRLRALADELDRPGTKGYAVVMREAVDALSERNRMLRHFSMAVTVNSPYAVAATTPASTCSG